MSSTIFIYCLTKIKNHEESQIPVNATYVHNYMFLSTPVWPLTKNLPHPINQWCRGSKVKGEHSQGKMPPQQKNVPKIRKKMDKSGKRGKIRKKGENQEKEEKLGRKGKKKKKKERSFNFVPPDRWGWLHYCHSPLLASLVVLCLEVSVVQVPARQT